MADDRGRPRMPPHAPITQGSARGATWHPPDGAAVTAGTPSEVRGARAVAATFSGRARAAQPALVNGAPGLVWAPGGRARVVFAFTIANGRIVEIDLIADRERVRRLDVSILDG